MLGNYLKKRIFYMLLFNLDGFIKMVLAKYIYNTKRDHALPTLKNRQKCLR